MTTTLQTAIQRTSTPFTPSLGLVQTALADEIALQARAADIELKARKVKERREYYDGDHPANLTDEMRNALRTTRIGSEFTDNYCKRVVHARSDRLIIIRVETDTKAGNAWAETLLDNCTFDALQNLIHKAALRDSESFITVSFNPVTGLPELTPELAYDGVNGVFALYKSANLPLMDAAVKVWHEISDDGDVVDIIRINVYFPNRVEKFRTNPKTGILEQYKELGDLAWPIWWTEDGTESGIALGIPIFHFMHNGEQNQGMSVLEDAIPLQDALNRAVYSLVFAGELTAFQMYVAFGFATDNTIAPGAWIEAPASPKDEQPAQVQVLAAGDLSQLIAELQVIKAELHDVTNTPMPGGVANDASGEARKQVEVYLLGEIRNFQIDAGATWEKTILMAHKLQKIYGLENPPPVKRFYTRWKNAEVRSNKETVENAVKVRPDISRKEFLRIVSDVLGYDEEKIDQILAEKEEEDLQMMADLAAQMPTLGRLATDKAPKQGVKPNG